MIVEHRMYLSLAAALAVAVVGAWRWAGEKSKGIVWAACGAAAVVALGLTVRRNADYRSEVGLWSDTVAKRPENPLAHFMLAGAQERAGDANGAMASYAEALRLKPDFSVGQENFGELLLRLGRRKEAIERFEAALRLQPDLPNTRALLERAKARQRP